jgi:hypothetical protein
VNPKTVLINDAHAKLLAYRDGTDTTREPKDILSDLYDEAMRGGKSVTCEACKGTAMGRQGPCRGCEGMGTIPEELRGTVDFIENVIREETFGQLLGEVDDEYHERVDDLLTKARERHQGDE